MVGALGEHALPSWSLTVTRDKPRLDRVVPGIREIAATLECSAHGEAIFENSLAPCPPHSRFRSVEHYYDIKYSAVLDEPGRH